MTTTFLGITVLSDLYVLMLITVTMAYGKASCYEGGKFGTWHARMHACTHARTRKLTGRRRLTH